MGQSQGPTRDSPIGTRALGQEKRNTKKPRERGGEEEWAHHLDEAIIGMQWRVDVEGGVSRDTLEHQLDVLLDLFMIKLPHQEHGPLEGCVWHHIV
jgi:hypothetical protein